MLSPVRIFGGLLVLFITLRCTICLALLIMHLAVPGLRMGDQPLLLLLFGVLGVVSSVGAAITHHVLSSPWNTLGAALWIIINMMRMDSDAQTGTFCLRQGAQFTPDSFECRPRYHIMSLSLLSTRGKGGAPCRRLSRLAEKTATRDNFDKKLAEFAAKMGPRGTVTFVGNTRHAAKAVVMLTKDMAMCPKIDIFDTNPRPSSVATVQDFAKQHHRVNVHRAPRGVPAPTALTSSESLLVAFHGTDVHHRDELFLPGFGPGVWGNHVIHCSAPHTEPLDTFARRNRHSIEAYAKYYGLHVNHHGGFPNGDTHNLYWMLSDRNTELTGDADEVWGCSCGGFQWHAYGRPRDEYEHE